MLTNDCKVTVSDNPIYLTLCIDHQMRLLHGKADISISTPSRRDSPCQYCNEAPEDRDYLSTLEAVNNARIRKGWVPISEIER